MLQQISESLGGMSAKHRKVAECMLADPKWFAHAAVAEISARAKVSQPTVIRFCRSLGYKGLPEFKLALAAAISREGMPYVHEALNTGDSMAVVTGKVLEDTAAAILGAHNFLDADALEKAVSLLAHARRIEFYGMGNSGIVAQDAQHKFFRFGISTVAYADVHIQLMASAVISDQDAVVAISKSGTPTGLLEAAAAAKENGAAVIAVTRAGSPLADLADCLINVFTQEDGDRYTPMVSRLLQLTVIDILAIGLALRLGEPASVQLEKSKRSLRGRYPGKAV